MATIATVEVTSPAPGTFSATHTLGHVPQTGSILMTSAGKIWWQAAKQFDAANVYLEASDADVTAKVIIW